MTHHSPAWIRQPPPWTCAVFSDIVVVRYAAGGYALFAGRLVRTGRDGKFGARSKRRRVGGMYDAVREKPVTGPTRRETYRADCVTRDSTTINTAETRRKHWVIHYTDVWRANERGKKTTVFAKRTPRDNTRTGMILHVAHARTHARGKSKSDLTRRIKILLWGERGSASESDTIFYYHIDDIDGGSGGVEVQKYEISYARRVHTRYMAYIYYCSGGWRWAGRAEPQQLGRPTANMYTTARKQLIAPLILVRG